MKQIFLTDINIKKVRHLENIAIPLSKEERKHLILTGKNGSGKTSTIEVLANYLGLLISDGSAAKQYLLHYAVLLSNLNKKESINSEGLFGEYTDVEKRAKLLNHFPRGIACEWSSLKEIADKFQQGEFILAYYGVDRKAQVEAYENIEKVMLKKSYAVKDAPGQKLTKYLVDLKATQAFSRNSEKFQRIDEWFDRFEAVLKKVYNDSTLRLVFDEETFQFTIHEAEREPFDFNTMSSGFAAVFDIINDLIMRMEAQSRLRVSFDVEGIVLIDEIETHLHLELQKEILPILTTLFPNIQFIISTHSPFILNSLKNTVVYDLEKKILVSNGLENLPYEGIVEGYFGIDRLSDELRRKFDRYKVLVRKEELSDEEYAEIGELEFYLDEIPDYLATETATEYSRLKLEFFNREYTDDKN